MCAPPFFELEIPRSLSVDLGIKIVMLLPQGVRRVEVLEILNESRAIEDAVSEVAKQSCEPTSAEHSACVAHRILPGVARPIRKRRAGDDNWTEELRPHSREHHDCPARLTISDHRRFAFRFRMERDHPLKKGRLSERNVFNRLPRHRLR